MYKLLYRPNVFKTRGFVITKISYLRVSAKFWGDNVSDIQ